MTKKEEKTTKPEAMNIWQKLALVRAEASVKKTGINQFAGYEYFELPAIYGEAKRLFGKYGLATRFLLHRLPDGWFKGVLIVINADNSKETYTTWTFSPPFKGSKMAPPQEIGAIMTYLKKYLYGELLMLDDGASDPDRWVNPEEHAETVKVIPLQQQAKPQNKPKQPHQKDPKRVALIRSCSQLFTAMKIAPVEAHELIDKWSKGKFKSIKEMPNQILEEFEQYLSGLKEVKDDLAKKKEVEPPADDLPEIEKENEGADDVPF